jgi:hypothetical protein
VHSSRFKDPSSVSAMVSSGLRSAALIRPAYLQS